MDYKGFVNDISPTTDDDKVFLRLVRNPDFIHWRKFVEDFQLKRAMNLIAGMELPEDIENPLDFYRGGYYLYKKIFSLVDKAEENIRKFGPSDQNEKNNS